jgi:hypothetical protein
LAVDATSGSTVWSYANSANVVQSDGTVVARNLVVVAFDCCARPGLAQGIPTTVVLDENNGSMRSSTENEVLNVATSQLAYGQLTDANSGQAATGAVDPADGTVKWTAPLTTQFAVSGSSMVYLSTDGVLHAVDARTGSAQWTSPAPAGTYKTRSDPVIAGGVIYLVVGNGPTDELRTYDATNGTAIGVTTTRTGSYTDPVVANGTVYVTVGGAITAYGPK